MAELTFQSLRFEDKGNNVRIHFQNVFYFEVDKSILNKIGKFTVDNHTISFQATQEKAERKFNNIIDKGFTELKNRVTNKPAYYIHKHSGIPLIGCNYFGLVDRGTNTIEVKPLTSCNLSCVYCSVDEGPNSRRKVDYIIEKDYLVQEFKKLIEFKGEEYIDAHINAQGEPTLYAEMVELVRDIAKIPQVKVVSIDTNGTLLTKEFIDKLADAGLTRFNLSLNALDQKIANQMAGFPYNLKKVKELAQYITTKMDLIIVPVYLPGINDDELEKLANFAKEIGAGKKCPAIGVQNFLPYKFGRNPVKSANWDDFYDKLKKIEEKTEVDMFMTKQDFKIVEAKEYKKPFKKGQTIEAEIVLPGRFPKEQLAVAKDRIISIMNCEKTTGIVKAKIKRTKHNIFIADFVA